MRQKEQLIIHKNLISKIILLHFYKLNAMPADQRRRFPACLQLQYQKSNATATSIKRLNKAEMKTNTCLLLIGILTHLPRAPPVPAASPGYARQHPIFQTTRYSTLDLPCMPQLSYALSNEYPSSAASRPYSARARSTVSISHANAGYVSVKPLCSECCS